MHTIIDVKRDEINNRIQFFTDTKYKLEINVGGDYIANPTTDWLRKNLGDEILSDWNLAIGKKFPNLPILTVDFIEVFIV